MHELAERTDTEAALIGRHHPGSLAKRRPQLLDAGQSSESGAPGSMSPSMIRRRISAITLACIRPGLPFRFALCAIFTEPSSGSRAARPPSQRRERAAVAVDQPSLLFDSYGNPHIAEVGRELDTLAQLIKLLGGEAPVHL
ncbi:hypothetical protein [Streptomyces sp. NBC_00443]|uniref:hypothetical protein n=1 Tax=Streptomyces sp. NBC_00443 TaxID=2975743 RepID=UPI002E1C33BC